MFEKAQFTAFIQVVKQGVASGVNNSSWQICFILVWACLPAGLLTWEYVVLFLEPWDVNFCQFSTSHESEFWLARKGPDL